MKSCSYKSFCSQASSQGYRAPGVRVHCCYSDDCNIKSFASPLPGFSFWLLSFLLLLHWLFFHRTHRQPDHANKNPFSIQMPTKCQKDCLFSHLMSSYWSLLHLTLVNVFIGVQDIKKMLHTEQWSNAYEPYKYISQLAASLMADRHGPVC